MSRKRRFQSFPVSSSLKEARESGNLAGTLCYGVHAVRAALEQAGTQFTALWLDQGRLDRPLRQIAEMARERGLEPCYVQRGKLEALVPAGRHQGVVAHCRPLSELTEENLLALLDSLNLPPLLLILDGVQDPHNLGACLRTAEAAGVHAVVAPKNRAVGLTAAARKVASGAAERVPFVRVTNLVRAMEKWRERGLWLVGTEAEGEESLYAADLQGPLGLVLGAENRGLRRLTREHCDRVVAIPMQGAVDSLNVSVAAGICLFEARRQRNFAL